MEQFFLNPWALAFAALSGGIVLLYILKLRRVKAEISSTLLWERAVHDFKANAPWQRLRRNLLMILQVIALILLAIALARPFIFGTALTGGRTVLVIDTSASMLATDTGPDRLEQALDAARKLVGDFSRNDEGMIIAAGPSPQIHASFTSNKAELIEALGQVRDGAGGVTDLDKALGLVSSIAKGAATRVVIFSDGAVPELSPFSATDLQIDFYPVGESGGNLAIIGAGARQNPFSDEYELFVGLHNFYPTPQEVDITLSIGDNVLDVRTVELNAGQRSEVVMTKLPYVPEPIRVAIDREDALAVDNEAYIVMPRQMRYKVALCTNGESLLLRQVLASLASIDLYTYEDGTLRTERAVEAGESAPEIDVWVVEDDAVSGIDPTASYLFIDTTAHQFLPVVAGTKAMLDFTADPMVVPSVVGVDRAHPVLRFVNIGDLRMQAMRRCQLQPWARTVVDATEGPLMVEGDLEGQRTLYLALNIYESDFPLRAAFPIFMMNALNYLGQSSAGFTGQSAAAGTLVNIVAPVEADYVEVTQPAGGEPLKVGLPTRDYALGRTAAVGIYHLAYYDEGGGLVEEADLPVSLVNDGESNLAPSETLRVQGVAEALGSGADPTEITGSREVRTNREFFTWLLIAVLLIMAVEWYLYHTRAL